jgi:hypothetical protein
MVQRLIRILSYPLPQPSSEGFLFYEAQINGTPPFKGWGNDQHKQTLSTRSKIVYDTLEQIDFHIPDIYVSIVAKYTLNLLRVLPS